MCVLQNIRNNYFFFFFFKLNLQVQQALKKHELLVAIIKKDRDHNKRLVCSLKGICTKYGNLHVKVARMLPVH